MAEDGAGDGVGVGDGLGVALAVADGDGDGDGVAPYEGARMPEAAAALINPATTATRRQPPADTSGVSHALQPPRWQVGKLPEFPRENAAQRERADKNQPAEATGAIGLFSERKRMSRIVRTSVRVGLAAAAATGLVAGGITVAQAAPHHAAASSSSSTPSLRVAITDKGFYVDGPKTFPAGRVHVSLDNARAKKEAEVEVLQLGAGYRWTELRSDYKTMVTNLFAPHGNKKKGLKALNHIIDNVKFFGGYDVMAGKSAHGTLLLPAAGSYVLFNDSSSLRNPHWLTVTSPQGPQTLPPADANVVAKTTRRFGGSTTLPAKGLIHFTNESTESPHFLNLQQVKPGTTRKDVISALQGNGPPPFLDGVAGTDTLSTGQSMDLRVHLPAGTYAEMCFFPDPKTGDPHAFMGMVRIVRLK